MTQDFLAFIKNPGTETFLQFREKVIRHDSYDFYTTDTERIDELITEGQYQDAIDLKGMNVLLNLKAHRLFSFAYDKLGNGKGRAAEHYIADVIMEHILLTGDGSKERPYLVSYLSDERLVVRHLGLDFIMQALVRETDRVYDCIQVGGGKRIYFDITAGIQKMEATFSPDTLGLDDDSPKGKKWWKFW